MLSVSKGRPSFPLPTTTLVKYVHFNESLDCLSDTELSKFFQTSTTLQKLPLRQIIQMIGFYFKHYENNEFFDNVEKDLTKVRFD